MTLALAVYLLGTFGIASAISILKTRVVFEKTLGWAPIVRDLIRCPACLSFWIGLAISLWVFSPSFPLVLERWKSALLDASAAMGTSLLLSIPVKWACGKVENF